MKGRPEYHELQTALLDLLNAFEQFENDGNEKLFRARLREAQRIYKRSRVR